MSRSASVPSFTRVFSVDLHTGKKAYPRVNLEVYVCIYVCIIIICSDIICTIIICSDMLPVNQFVKGKYVVIVSAKVYAWRVRILGLILRLFFRTDEISLRCHEDTRRNFADG